MAGSAPLSGNSRTTRGSARSVATARINGVIPRTSCAFTLAPASRRTLTTSGPPIEDARISAVNEPSAMGPFFTGGPTCGGLTALTFPPFASNSWRTSTLPAAAAFISAIVPPISLVFAPLSSNSLIVVVSFASAADESGVFIWVSATFTFAPRSSSSLTISEAPSMEDAISSGVRPIFERAFTSAPFSIRSLTLS